MFFYFLILFSLFQSIYAYHPSNWKLYPNLQIPEYTISTDNIQNQLSKRPPLVFAGEIRNLKNQLKSVHSGKSFILQAGPCVETFDQPNWTNNIQSLMSTIIQTSLVIGFGMEKKVIRIGRIAGQYAKPRTQEFEKDGVTLTYRGDIIHGLDIHDRTPDPNRMLQAYYDSISSLNTIRSFAKSGDLGLDSINHWLNPCKEEIEYHLYNEFHSVLKKSIVFLNQCGINSDTLREPDFFISHEALLLYYEESLTRLDSITNEYYNCAAHTVWLGERTRHSKAHIEYLKGIQNPIGIKVGPTTVPNDLMELIKELNPNNELGKIMIITRMGNLLSQFFPSIINICQKNNLNVIYMCDPCHGNTIVLNGYKTRFCYNIHQEIIQFFDCCFQMGVYPGGIHIEMSGEMVTECIGQNITVQNLSNQYLTKMDPRLNRLQTLELGFFLSSIHDKLSHKLL